MPFSNLKNWRWKMDEKWKHIKNRHAVHFWKMDVFHLISGSIFHLIFLKNEIKNEIKNGSKMNTPNHSLIVTTMLKITK